MELKNIFLLAGLGGIGYWLYVNQDSAEDLYDEASSTVTAALYGWPQAGSGPTWMPVLNNAEDDYGLPPNLLARMAYQESSFIENVIRGIKKSSAGALGIMQLMPQYFSTVQVPVPFSDSDVSAQITQAAQQMQALFAQFESWPLALAAYNAGAGNVAKYGGIPPFAETQNYVAAIVADVPGIQSA